VTEAMWKSRPSLGGPTPGIKAQILDGVTGRIVDDPESSAAVANALDEMLRDDKSREVWGRNARARISREFLIFSEAKRWLRLLAKVVTDQTGAR